MHVRWMPSECRVACIAMRGVPSMSNEVARTASPTARRRATPAQRRSGPLYLRSAQHICIRVTEAGWRAPSLSFSFSPLVLPLTLCPLLSS